MKTGKFFLPAALLTAFAAAPAFADDDYRHYEQHRDSYISHEEAAQIAREAVGGGRVTDVEFDRDFSGGHFEVEVISPEGVEYDVVIDAKNGKVMKKQRDY